METWQRAINTTTKTWNLMNDNFYLTSGVRICMRLWNPPLVLPKLDDRLTMGSLLTLSNQNNTSSTIFNHINNKLYIYTPVKWSLLEYCAYFYIFNVLLFNIFIFIFNSCYMYICQIISIYFLTFMFKWCFIHNFNSFSHCLHSTSNLVYFCKFVLLLCIIKQNFLACFLSSQNITTSQLSLIMFYNSNGRQSIIFLDLVHIHCIYLA